MVVAATGDDKVNLVVSLLAKTEFAVPRVVARVNRAENEWLFTEQWGVDVSVSKPRLMAALVEEAVTVGDLVRLMTFRQGQANLVEITLPEDAPLRRPGRSATCRCRATPRWWRSCAASGCSCRTPTTRWRPATSWSSWHGGGRGRGPRRPGIPTARYFGGVRQPPARAHRPYRVEQGDPDQRVAHREPGDAEPGRASAL